MSNDPSSSKSEVEMQKDQRASSYVEYSGEPPFEYEIALRVKGSTMGASAAAGAAVAHSSPEATIIDASGWEEDEAYIIYVYCEYDEKPDVQEIWTALQEEGYSVCEINRLGKLVER